MYELPPVSESEILKELGLLSRLAQSGYIPKDQLLEHFDRVEGQIVAHKGLLHTLRAELHPASA